MPSRFGTGELYGFDFSTLSAERVRQLSSVSHRDVECPFKPPEEGKPARRCNKKGGVCSLRLFVQEAQGQVLGKGEPVITCPSRFLEADLVVRWVGEVLLGTSTPVVISELPFLMGEVEAAAGAEPDAVGKIDKVLVNPDGDVLKWCALEMQAVYFSGMSMENDFKIMRKWEGPGVPFPNVQRRNV